MNANIHTIISGNIDYSDLMQSSALCPFTLIFRAVVLQYQDLVSVA